MSSAPRPAAAGAELRWIVGVNPAFRLVVKLAIVVFGLATCGAASSDGKTKCRFASVHGSQQSGKSRR